MKIIIIRYNFLLLLLLLCLSQLPAAPSVWIIKTADSCTCSIKKSASPKREEAEVLPVCGLLYTANLLCLINSSLILGKKKSGGRGGREKEWIIKREEYADCRLFRRFSCWMKRVDCRGWTNLIGRLFCLSYF